MNPRDIARRIPIRVRNYIGGLQLRRQPDAEYQRRVDAEKSFFNHAHDANVLPPIYNYWSNTYLRPKLERFGFSHPEALFAGYFAKSYVASSAEVRRYASIGSGACETEIRLAEALIERGHTSFVIDCMDFNEAELERGAAFAREKHLERYIRPVQADFNTWTAETQYDGVVANSSLHHIVDLEHLFAAIRQCLAPTGFFVTSDTIGRNGHLRWPEALALVDEFWQELPKSHTYNHLLRRSEVTYENWDCSSVGFEGIRAQDILPLLIEHFSFDCFVPFGNVIDPFIERTFGPNFDAANPADIDFIDRVHFRDEAEMARGAIKPAHLVAAMCVANGAKQYSDGLTPEFCVRWPASAPQAHGPLVLRTTVAQAISVAATGENVMRSATSSPAVDATTDPANYSDLWWNPDEPGWGLSVHHHASSNVFATWFVYDADGAPVWYSMQPGQWTSKTTYMGPVYKATGPHFQGPHDNAKVSLRNVGSGTLAFSDHATGTFTYDIDGAKATKAITRMTF